jgi:HEAT repeat protein
VRKLGPLFFISILLLATTSLAQGGGDLPKKGGKKSGGRLDLPAGQEKPAVEEQGPSVPTEAYQSEFWGETKNRAELVFIRLEDLDQKELLNKEQMRKALDELHGLGLQTRATGLKALNSPHSSSVILAAQLLRAVGDREEGDAKILVETASSVGQVEAAQECLDAAVVIFGKLPARAIALISHPKRSIRTLTEGRVRMHPDSEFVPDLLRGLRYGRDPDIRIRCARLLEDYPTTPEARAGLREALKDPSVTVCFRAAQSLAGQASKDEQEYVRDQILATEPSLELGYLIFSLLLQQESTGELLVDDELFGIFRQLLGNDDIFLSGIAGSAVAEYVFRSDVEENLDTLERSLPLVLVRAVGGVEFYPQFARFSPFAETSLRRISGQDFGNRNRRAWIEWFTSNRETFQLVRGKLLLTPENEDQLEVSWFHKGGESRLLTGSINSGLAGALPGRVLGTKGLKQLADVLQSTVILDVSVLPGTYGLLTDPVRDGIEVRIGGRRKPVRFRGQSAAAWLLELLENLDTIYEELEWQVLASGSQASSFLNETIPQWDEKPANQRASLLVSFQNERVANLEKDALEAWCQHLLRTPEVKAHWGVEAAYQFLGCLERLKEDPELARMVLQVALMDKNPAMTASAVETAFLFEEPFRSDLLVSALRLLGTGPGAACLKDERLPVRVAAASALAEGGADAVPALLTALELDDVLVVRVALHSLGAIGDSSALQPVLQLATPSSPREVRKEAILALGSFADPIVLGTLLEAAYAEDFGTKLAAISSLRKVPGAEADQLFTEILPHFLATNLESRFDQSLRARGAGIARRTYRGFLEDGKNSIRRRAAILSGRLGEPAAVPVLMDLLPQTPHDTEVLDALAMSTCADFRSTPDPAGVYAVWWRDHVGQDSSLWLVDGLKGRDFDLAEHFVEGSGAKLQTIVGDLLKVLNNGPVYLRPAVAVYLTALTGIDAPPILPGLPKEEIHRLSDPWVAWLYVGSDPR